MDKNITTWKLQLMKITNYIFEKVACGMLTIKAKLSGIRIKGHSRVKMRPLDEQAHTLMCEGPFPCIYFLRIIPFQKFPRFWEMILAIRSFKGHPLDLLWMGP